MRPHGLQFSPFVTRRDAEWPMRRHQGRMTLGPIAKETTDDDGN